MDKIQSLKGMIDLIGNKSDSKDFAESIFTTEEVLKNKRSMLEILSRNTGKTIEEISKDSDRMSYLNPQEALDYGVIDRILTSQKDLPNKI